MEIPSHLEKSKDLVQDPDTGVITMHFRSNQPRDNTDYEYLNNAVKRVIQLPKFGCIAVDVTNDFIKRNENGQFISPYPANDLITPTRFAYAIYESFNHTKGAFGTNPDPAFYIILPTDIKHECMLPLKEQDLQLIDAKVIDGLKSNDKYFPEEDPVRQALRERYDMEDSAPSDQAWHYDPLNVRYAIATGASQPEEPKRNPVPKQTIDINADRAAGDDVQQISVAQHQNDILKIIVNGIPTTADEIAAYRDEVKMAISIISAKLNSAKKKK